MNPRLIPTSRLARVTVLRSESDERLSFLAGHGSDAAFEAIVHRYRGPLLGHCTRILGSRADAEEATQDALVSAHAALMNGHDVRSLKPWLHTVAHNAALRLLRRRVARAECPQAECNGQARFEAPDGGQVDLREVVEAVQALPPRQRDAIVMRELEGRSYAEIAARLGASDGAVRQLLNRARSSMRNTLGALVPAEPLLRWLVCADDNSPVKGILTLSGGSAVAIKLSGAAALSAVTVAALLPSAHAPVRPGPARIGAASGHHAASRPAGGRSTFVASGSARRGYAYPISSGTTAGGGRSTRARLYTTAPATEVAFRYSAAMGKAGASQNPRGGGQSSGDQSGGGQSGGGSRRPTRRAPGGQPTQSAGAGQRSAPADGSTAGSGSPPPTGSTGMIEARRQPSNPPPTTGQTRWPEPDSGSGEGEPPPQDG